MIISRFPESLLDFSLSLSHKETFQGTKHNWIGMPVRSLCHISSGVVGMSLVWRGQVSPCCFCLGAGISLRMLGMN